MPILNMSNTEILSIELIDSIVTISGIDSIVTIGGIGMIIFGG